MNDLSTRRSRNRRAGVPMLAALAIAACSGSSPLGEAFTHTPAWDAYAESLEDAGLAGTALGREWIAAGARALREAPPVDLPYREAGYVAADAPRGVAYRLSLRRGHRLLVALDTRSAEPARVFLDLFRSPPATDSLAAPERVAEAIPDSLGLDVEIDRDGEYVLRVQPELLRGLEYEITLHVAPVLAFPVEGAGNRDVRSGWGDPRDGGARSHRGVDIFAARGTPAIAVEPGRVRRAGTNRLGGNTVWISGRDGRRYYYAHLDRPAVRGGEEVAVGDTVGFVGNTGNARTTPPHLHFGIRDRGWVDPHPYIARTETRPAPLSLDTDRIGGWVRARGDLNLRRGPGTGEEMLGTLPRHTVARVVAGTADWFRVELPDLRTGFVYAPLTDGVDAPVERRRFGEARVVRDAPTALAAAVDSVAPGDEVERLGRFGDWDFVRSAGRDGWMLDADAAVGR